MKSIVITIILAAFTAAPAEAFASRECDWARQVHKAEPHIINGRNVQIGQIQAEIAAEKRTIDVEIQPRLDIWNHTIKGHDARLASLREAVLAIRQIGTYLEGTVSSDLSLKLILEQIRNSQRLSPDRRLAEQIRDIARNSNMSSDGRESLINFANTVHLLENTHAEFAAAEAKMIEDYLNGRNTLVKGMLDTINSIGERLTSDIAAQDTSSHQDRASAADLVKQIEAAKARQDARAKKIQTLVNENAASATLMNQWKVEDHCPTQTPREIFPHPT